MQLARLEVTLMRIVGQIRKDPSCAPNLRRLMVYYLPTTMKLLDAYGELDREPMEGGNITSTKREIREAMGTVNEAFENLLDSLFQDMAWDISSDISVMKTMMAQDGLTGDGFRNAGPGHASEKDAEGYRDGYTEGFTEEYVEGAGAAQASSAGEERAQGIRLTFGE